MHGISSLHRTRRLCWLLQVAVALSFPAAASAQTARDTMTPPLADLDWSLLTLDGQRRTLASFRGQVLIVNSWATWCEPCVAELQSLQALRTAIADTSLRFVLVAAQRREPVAAFVRRRSLQLPVYLEATPAPAIYRFDAVPTTWIVDREGRIVLRHRGARRWDTPMLREFVLQLLARKPREQP